VIYSRMTILSDGATSARSFCQNNWMPFRKTKYLFERT